MALDIKINGEGLELQPGTSLELEQQNPFLQFADQIMGDYSLPFEVRATHTNLRLLQYQGIFQSKANNAGMDCEIVDNGLQHSMGKIKVEKPSCNLNQTNRGNISLYILGGIASFYQDIKDVNLMAVPLGGVRSFLWDAYNRAGDGFWGHVHQVIDAPAGYGTSGFDYAFYPVINKSFANHSELMNNMAIDAGQPLMQKEGTAIGYHANVNPIVPFPYLKYVLKKAVEHVGWNISGDALDDPDFIKATMVNFQAIDWGYRKKFAPGLMVIFGKLQVKFNLQDHMPDISLAEFLIALKNRFAWWYDFDRKSKTIKISSLDAVVNSSIKDFTAQASPLITKTINKDPKIWALRNQFSGEYANGQPDFKQVTFLGSLENKGLLPAANEAYSGHCYLVLSENNFYICRASDDTGDYGWEIFAYNVYDYAPDGANEDITTAATTLGNEYYNAYLNFIPRMDNQGAQAAITDVESSWGIHLLFYHGKRLNPSGQLLPFAGSGIYDCNGAQVAQWALTFQCQKYDGTEVGLYERWKAILLLLRDAETIETTLRLSKTDYLNLQFSDVVSVAGVRFYIKTLKSAIPFKNAVVIEGVRI